MWVDGTRRSRSGLAYRRSGSGPPVVLLHGIPGSAESWREVADGLIGGYDVIVPDLLGFGASDQPEDLRGLHAVAQACALDDLIDELGVGPVTVVGHDFGGPVALSLAARRPGAVTALGLLATNTFTDTPIPFPLSAATWPVVGPLVARAVFSTPSLRMMLRQGVGHGASVPDPATHLGERAQRHAIVTIFEGSLVHLAELYGPIEAELRRTSVPTLVGWGDHDPFLPVAQGERTAQTVGAALRVYEGAGHFLPHERPAEVAADITALAATAAA